MENGVYVIIFIVIIVIIGLIIWLVLAINDNQPSSPNSVPNKGNVGDNCNNDDDCKNSNACQLGVCRAKIGSLCFKVNECVNEATACTKDTHVCTAHSLPSEGQSCKSLPCINGLNCIAEICTPSSNSLPVSGPAALNQSCHLPDRPCQNGLICDSSSGNICKIATGDNCNSNDDCVSGDRCGFQFDADGEEIGSKVCTTLIPNYKHCVVDRQCESGRCGASSLLAYIPDDVRALELKLLDSYLQDGRLVPIQRFIDQSLLDVISEGRNLIMLLEDGTILREVNNSRGGNFLETINTNRVMQRLISLGGVSTGGPATVNIYGLSDNYLYELDRNRSSSNNWIWRQVEWAPVDINHISRSHDGNFLWLQYRLLGNSGYHQYNYDHNSSFLSSSTDRYSQNNHHYYGHHYYPYSNDNDTYSYEYDSDEYDSDGYDNDGDYDSDSSVRTNYGEFNSGVNSSVTDALRSASSCKIDLSKRKTPIQFGALYQYDGLNRIPRLVQRTIVPDNIQRLYGLNNLNYLEVDLENRQAIRYPLGDTIANFYVGVLLSDGSVFKLGVEFIERVRTAIYARGLAHIITFRLCRPRLLNNDEIIEEAVQHLTSTDDNTETLSNLSSINFEQLAGKEVLQDARTINYSVIK